MKKVGIVISIILLLLALCIYILGVKGAENSGVETPVVTTVAAEVSRATTPATTTIASTATPIMTTPVPATQSSVATESTPELAEEQVPAFVEIDQSTLPVGVTKDEVGVIASKDIVYLDGALYYRVKIALLDSDNVLSYIANKVGYDLLEKVMKVQVNYTIYTNSAGKDYSIVNSVTLLS